MFFNFWYFLENIVNRSIPVPRKGSSQWTRVMGANSAQVASYDRGSYRLRGIPINNSLIFHSQREITFLAVIPTFKHILPLRQERDRFFLWGIYTDWRIGYEFVSVRLFLRPSPGVYWGRDKACPLSIMYWLKGILQEHFKSIVSEARGYYSDFLEIKQFCKGVNGDRKEEDMHNVLN